MELQTLLRIPVYANASVVAGQKGLTRKVHNVNMMDAPDILSFLKEGEFLVTTGYHFKEKEESLLHLVEGMAKKHCAGLAIKTKRFFEQVPPSICELAERLNFPIIDLQTNETLGSIINESLSFILDKKTTELQQAMITHQLFSSYILQGKGIEKIMVSLQTLCKAHVSLYDPHGNLLFKSDQQPIRQTLPMEDVSTRIDSFFLNRTKYTTFSFYQFKETVTVFPVSTHTQKSSYLLVHTCIDSADPALLTIEQAANVLSFEMMRQHALKEAERRQKNEYFNQLTSGYYKTIDEASYYGNQIGLSSDKKYICAVGRVSTTDSSYLTSDMIYELIEYELSKQTIPCMLFTKENRYVTLFFSDNHDKQQLISKQLVDVQQAVNRHYQKQLCFGIGNQSQTLLTVIDSYREASEALAGINTQDSSGQIQFYQPKQFRELLRLIPSYDLEEYHSQTLEGLLLYDKKDQAILLDTLSTYLNLNCQISETAKQLFVHRNTVIYRIEKCEELLGRSIHSSEETLRLRIAFQIHSYLQAV
ncbi:PucR family transcriptional regulator [Priestia megaterium]|nr:PucR family transcriptional regulator [Priestia megaterium]